MRLASFLACVLLGIVTSGCGDDGAPAAPDASTIADAGVDADLPDAYVEDAGPPCSPASPGDPPAGRWALSMLHFNIQYVAGGLVGIFPGLERAFMYDEVQTEDLIVVQSFLPILDLLEAHPSWQLTVEMQGRMIEVLRDRFPSDLARTQALVASRQIELVAFHFSDQNIVAYPKEHGVRSLAHTRAIAADNGLTLSTTVFTQEGFFGPGVADAMRDNGLGVAAIGKNLIQYQHASLPTAAFFDLDGTPVVPAGRGVPVEAGAEVRWTFFNDGELLAAGVSPYLGDYFRRDDRLVARYADELACLEHEGFRIGRIDDYADALRAAGIAPVPLPALLDGDWQPRDTNNVGRWMGRVGMFKDDRDNRVNTGNVRAGVLLSAAETLLAGAGASALGDGRVRLDDAWRELWLGEVSDATGWGPWRGEVDYGIAHGDAARTDAESFIEDQLAALGWSAAEVDPATGAVTERTGAPPASGVTPATAPIAVTVDSPARPVVLAWSRRPDGVYVLDVDISPAGDATLDTGEAPVELGFPSTSSAIAYTPAWRDVVETHPLGDFDFDEIWLPAQNGLAGVDGGFLVKDETTVHLAIGYTRDGRVLIRDETVPTLERDHWRILFTTGDEAAALALARATNEARPLWLCRADAACGL